MNISRENIDDLNAVIRVSLEPIDYQSKVEATLQDYRKKARFDGFRPGKVPASLVKKMYGKSIQADEIQRLLTETLNSYIQDNKLKILGEPLPNVNTPAVDWENGETFEFHFDVAFSPEIELDLSKKGTLTEYAIDITPDMVSKQIEDYTRRFGSLQPVETIADEDVVRGDLCEVESGEVTEREPVHSHGTLVYIKTIGDEEIKNQFIGLKTGDKLVFNPTKAFPNETDRAALLKVTKEELSGIDSDFEFTIQEISRFSPAEIGQELFDRAFGEGAIDSTDAFDERVNEDLKRQFSRETRYKLHLDIKDKLMSETEVPIPEEFLKRWMLLTSKDESLTQEQLDKDFPSFAHDLKWRMIKNTIIGEQNLEATDDEIREQAIWAAQSRFFQYGIYNAPPEQLFRLAESLLKSEEEKNRIADVILENKAIEYVMTQINIEEKSISLEEFNTLMDENKK